MSSQGNIQNFWWFKGQPNPGIPFPKGLIPWNKGRHGIQIAWNKGKRRGRIKTCPTCGSDFYVSLSRIDAKFCSHKCRASFYKKLRRTCLNCKKLLKRSDSKTFCSRHCRNSFISKGQIPWNKGKTWPDGVRRKMRENHADFSLEKHPNWRGGSSYKPYPVDFNDKIKEIVRQRDNYRCRLCGKSGLPPERELHVHHVDRNKDKNDLSNLVSVCPSCHSGCHGKEVPIFAV